MNDLLELRKHTTALDYRTDFNKIKHFLLFYSESDIPKYLSILKSRFIDIDLEDIVLFDDTGLEDRIRENTMSYLGLFYEAIDSILFDADDIFLEDEEDIFYYHRIARLKEKHPSKKATEVFPAPLLRNYRISFRSKSSYYKSIREVKSNDIGKLIKIRGILTRISQAKPFAEVCTYVCESCGSETYQLVNNEIFDLLEECLSEKCKVRALKGTLHLQTRGSKFIKYQSLRVQELTFDVPKGCVPRTINVECYGSVNLCRPGDFIRIEGVFLPRPYHGYKKMKAGLITDTFFYAMNLEVGQDNILPGMSSNMTCVDLTKFFGISNMNNQEICYNIDRIVDCIAPEIFGMHDVKKILLLMLIGAPSKIKSDGMKIRGDINVLLVGDPGIAKSQLLRTVSKISTRGVYTTGKGSSSVGLTASVIKDSITSEMILEGGALVLSDGGICCIDELDKMSDNDRVSIHEVMEQQTVSISKAGINTTLNARCGVLGAANPIKGLYNTKKSVEYNVGLSCALLSRFDVLVILKDEPDMQKDLKLANHISLLHIEDKVEDISYNDLSHMIENCKKIVPSIPPKLAEKLSNAYVEARQRNSLLTPRYLLSLIRLSLAHARLRLSDTINDLDVEESIRLMSFCCPNTFEKVEKINPKHAIYNLIISLGEKLSLKSLYEVVGNRFKKEDIDDCLREFEQLGVWIVQDEHLVILN